MRNIKSHIYRAHRVYKKIFNPVSVGARALVVCDEKITLVKHTYMSGWYLPGGTVERHESFQSAICRELHEECGVVAVDPRLFNVYFSRLEGRSDYIALFIVEKFEIHPRQSESEIADVQSFQLDSLPNDVSPATKARVDEYRKGHPTTDLWPVMS